MSQTTDQARGKTSGRSANGKRSRPGSAGASLSTPSPPKRRRPALTALAVLLIVGGAALAGLLAVRMDSREPVVVLKADVSNGDKITESMLESKNVSGDGLNAIPYEDRDRYIGTYARQTIYKGQLLVGELLRQDPPLEVDQAQVGVPLSSGKYPPGLRSGDAVRLVKIGDSQSPSRALATALVIKIDKSKSSSFGGADASSSVATVIVPQSVVDDVVGATGDDQLGIALIGRGVGIEDADIQELSTGSNN